LERRWTCKSRALPSGSAPFSLQLTGTAPALLQMPHQSISCFIFALTREQDPEIHELLRLRQQLTPNPEGNIFRQRTMASDLEVLTLIPTAAHSTANHPSACWRSQSDVADRTTSSAKSRDAILRSPNRTLSTPRLHLEILSMKITNHKQNRDKGQPWQSPTPTENVLVFVPRIRTLLSLCLYKDRMARTNGPGTPYSRSTPHRILRGTCLLQFFTISATSAKDMGEASPESSDSASSTEDVLVGFRSSSKCSFHRLTISSVWVSSSPPRQSTA